MHKFSTDKWFSLKIYIKIELFQSTKFIMNKSLANNSHIRAMRWYNKAWWYHMTSWNRQARPQLELIILWCPTTKMLIKACFLIQPLDKEGGYQKCCISLCSKVFTNYFYQMKASPGCLNFLIHWSKYWVDRLRRTLRKKFRQEYFINRLSTLPLYFTSSSPHRLQHS